MWKHIQCYIQMIPFTLFFFLPKQLTNFNLEFISQVFFLSLCCLKKASFLTRRFTLNWKRAQVQKLLSSVQIIHCFARKKSLFQYLTIHLLFLFKLVFCLIRVLSGMSEIVTMNHLYLSMIAASCESKTMVINTKPI